MHSVIGPLIFALQSGHRAGFAKRQRPPLGAGGSDSSNALFFASEMKAILESEEVSRKIRLDSVPLYLAYQFIPSPMQKFLLLPLLLFVKEVQ